MTLSCVFCQSANETCEHLLVQCVFARNLWNKLMQWLQRGPVLPMHWEQFVEWAIKNSKGRTQAA